MQWSVQRCKSDWPKGRSAQGVARTARGRHRSSPRTFMASRTMLTVAGRSRAGGPSVHDATGGERFSRDRFALHSFG